MDDPMCHVLCAGTQSEHGKNLRARIDGQPEPEYLCGTAQPGAQFIQLQVWEVEMAKDAFVQGVCVLASASHPGGDSRLSVAKDAFSRGRIQPFGQRRQHDGDLLRRGFQAVQGRVASGTECAAASLAAKGLDAFGLPMRAIADQRVDVSIGDAAVRALVVGTSEPLGVDVSGCSPPAFYLAPGAHRSWRWPSTQRRRGAETTGRAIFGGAGLEQTVERAALGPSSWGGRPKRESVKTPQQCQREEETDHQQEHEQMKGHTKPRCVKWGEARAS